MIDRDHLLALERILAKALTRRNPERTLDDRAGLPDELARAIHSIRPHELEITRLLVARLRFERLMHGSRVAREWFAEDAEDFADAFRDYHHETAATAAHPWDEATSFSGWLAERGGRR